jgi:hypothetical protein
MRSASNLLLLVACMLTFGCSSSSSSTATPTTQDAGLNHGIGESCPGGRSDCATGLDCDTSDTGGGQCFKVCSASKDTDCGDVTKYACNYEGHCYPRCGSTTDCKRASEGYLCKDDSPARAVKFCDAPH